MAIELKWQGPFALWPGKNAPWFYEHLPTKLQGAYLWAVPVGKGFRINYVGEAYDVRQRQAEHIQNYLAGKYTVHDPVKLVQGEKRTLYQPGEWGRFVNDFANQSSIILEYLKMLRLFIAPVIGDKHRLRQVESRILETLRHSGQPHANLIDNIRLSTRDIKDIELVNNVSNAEYAVFDGIPSHITSEG